MQASNNVNNAGPGTQLYDDSMIEYCYSGDGYENTGSNDDLYLQPRGSFETESRWQLDLQFSKAFHVGRVDMTAIIAVYNLFSVEGQRRANSFAFREASQTRVDEGDLDGYEPVYRESDGLLLGYFMPIGQTTSYYQPWRYELGFRIEF